MSKLAKSDFLSKKTSILLAESKQRAGKSSTSGFDIFMNIIGVLFIIVPLIGFSEVKSAIHEIVFILCFMTGFLIIAITRVGELLVKSYRIQQEILLMNWYDKATTLN